MLRGAIKFVLTKMPAETQNQKTNQPAGQTNTSHVDMAQYSDVGGITISFRTMPKDMEFAIARSKGAPLATQKATPATSPAVSTTPLAPIPQEEALLPILFSEPKSEEFLSKLAHPDNETEKKLEEIKLKKDKEAEEKEKKEKIKTLYKEAKSFSKDGLFQEAAKKIEELLVLYPGHWRAKWMLLRISKKAANQKGVYAKIQAQTENAKLQLSDQLKAEEEKNKEIEEKLKSESAVAAQKEEELQKARQEKNIVEQEMQEIQQNISRIQQEAEEKITAGLKQQMQQGEENAQREREARAAVENQLQNLQQEKSALEAKLFEEEKLLAEQKESQTSVTQKAEKAFIEERKKQEELLFTEKKKLEEEAKARQEYIQAQEKLRYQPAQNILPQTAFPTTEMIPEKTVSPASFQFIETLTRLFQQKNIKIAAIILSLIIILSGVIYFIGAWQLNKPDTQPGGDQTMTEIVPPSPLFSVDATEKITLQAGQKKNLFRDLEKLSQKPQTPGKFTRIIIEIDSQSQEKKLMELTDLIDSLGAAFPAEILSNSGKEYTLFIYSQKEAQLDPFLAGLGKNKLGLVISINKKEEIKQQFSDWEKTMPDDLEALFLGKKISFLASYQFNETNYQNTDIRYIDLPNQISSLNYSFYNNKILITTSGESMKALIDKMMPTK